MLCIKQIIGLALIPTLLLVSAYVIPSILESLKSYSELRKPRKFNIFMAHRWGQGSDSRHLGDTYSDVSINLEITYPHATLMVDEPVDIKGSAIIQQEHLPTLRSIQIALESARSYPPIFNENGLPEFPHFFLNEIQDNKMVGTVKVFWPLEGRYKATFHLEFQNHPIFENKKIQSQNNVDLITVYPKSETAQITTNKAIAVLTIALYFLGFIATIKIIIDLLTLP